MADHLGRIAVPTTAGNIAGHEPSLNPRPVKLTMPDPGLVIVEGDRTDSRLLTRAGPLSDQARIVLPELKHVLGFEGSVKRAIGRWVPEQNLLQAMEWLCGL